MCKTRTVGMDGGAQDSGLLLIVHAHVQSCPVLFLCKRKHKCIRSDEDDESENEESTSAVESVEGSVEESSSSSESDTDGDQDTENCEDIEVDDRKGADVLLNIHDQLDLEKLQQVVGR